MSIRAGVIVDQGLEMTVTFFFHKKGEKRVLSVSL